MDAQVAYGFHHLRNEKPYLAQGPIANKVGLIIFPLLVLHDSISTSVLVLFFLNFKHLLLLEVGLTHEVETNYLALR